jgi:hypothetical protein
MSKSLVALSISLILTGVAHGTNKPGPTPPTTPSPVSNSSVADSVSSASSSTGPVSATGIGGTSSSNATGGTGGVAHSDSRADADATSNSGGNTQSTTFNSTTSRNAPAVFAPTVFPTASCQGGFSLGGSGVNGGGAIGFGFTKKECQTVVLAQNLASLGFTQLACEALMSTPSAKRVWPEAKDRVCDAPRNTDSEVEIRTYDELPVRRDDLYDLERLFDQKLERAFKGSVSK